MTTKTFPLGQYLLATEGIALMRSWCLDDESRSERFLGEAAGICRDMNQPPYADGFHVREQTPVTGYTAWAQTYDEDNKRNPLVSLESGLLDDLLRPVSGGRALDAACGTGRQDSRLLSLGYEVTGVDATPAMLDVARRDHPSVRYLEGDLRALPVADGEFDLVLCTLAVTHVAELDKVVSEFARAVRPGGRVVMVDVHPVQVLLGAHVTVSDKDSHLMAVRNHVHLASRYLEAFARCGLTVESCSEPVFTDASVEDLPAAPHIPEANRIAFAGTPALLAWSLRNEKEKAK